MVLGHNITEKNRTRDIEISVDVTFDSMLLKKSTLEGLKNSGFYKPSPIQLHGIPLGKCGFDLFIEAKSGTGKTAVFTIIALEKLDLNKGLQSVILAPTREIAAQICDVIKQIGSSYEDLNVQVVMGGLPVQEDIEKFESNVHILVGSPGRLRHLIQDEHVDVSAVRLLVLDEADKLMDKSFQADINYIFSVLPKVKQVIMSSATYPNELRSIMQNYVQQAQHICPDSTSILLGIQQFITTVPSHINIVTQTRNRFKDLLKILSNREFKQCLIFCNYQVRVGEVCKMLQREKWPAERLHGQLEQVDRLDALKTLQEYKCRILVSTDLAARGIDASNVDLVINFEPPFEWQTYLHRIGRAGRFGSYGIAITILSEGQEVSKFTKMLTGITSLNLKYLWTDQKLVLDSDTDSLENLTEEPSGVKELGETSKEVKHTKATELDNVCKTVKEPENTCDITKLGDSGQLQEVQEICKIPEMEDICQTPEMIDPPIDDFEELLENSKCENDKSVESFANLFESFEKSKRCKFDSHDEAQEPNKNERNYEHNEILMTLFDAVLDGETEPYIIIESNSEPEYEVEKPIIQCESINDSIAKNQENKEICNNSFKEQVEQHDLSKNSNLIQFSDSQRVSSFVANISATSQEDALKNAGLPTCFGSSKYRNRKQANKANLQNEGQDKAVDNTLICFQEQALKDAGLPTSFNSSRYHNRKSTEPLTENSKVNHKKKTNRSKNKKCVKNQENKEEEIKQTHLESSYEAGHATANDDGYNTHSHLFSRSTKYVPSINKHQQKSCNKNCRATNTSEIQYNSVGTHYDINEKYKSWHRQFKCHIKQVEMALYIEELSKM